jgi:hypothetical protein
VRECVRDLLGAAGPGLICVAGLAGIFVLYVGVTLVVTLFHSDEKTRKHAAGVLRQLLHAVVALFRGAR